MKRRVLFVILTGVLGLLLVGLFLATASPAAVQAADPLAPAQDPFWEEDFSAALPPATYFVSATTGSGLVDNGSFLLTQNAIGQRGRIFYVEFTEMTDFMATFRLYLGNYDGGADGAAFHFCPDYEYPPDGGGTLDAACPGGYFVAFDTIEDFYNDLVYVGFESWSTRLALAGVPNLEDGAWHDAAVLFFQGTISVYLDGDPVISSFAIPDYESFEGYFGFSAATGALSNEQRVDDIWVEDEFGVGLLEGHVLNAERMTPIGGAAIQAVREDGSPWNALTDATGYYSMPVPTGIYTVTAEHPTYLTGLTSGVEVIADEATTVDFDLRPKMVVEPGMLEAWLLPNTASFVHPSGLEISNNTEESLEFRVFDFPATLAAPAQSNLELGFLGTRSSGLSTQSERPGSVDQAAHLVVPTAPSSMAGTGVLLIQDSLPWGSAAMATILASNLIPYDLINSSQIPTVDFSPYKVIIIPSVQGSAYNTNFNNNLSKFESYIDAGGLVLMSFCEWGIFDPFRVLPFGGTNNYQLEYYNYIVDPTHPIFAGVPNPYYSPGGVSLNFLTDLLPGDRWLVTGGDAPGGNVIMIERDHGAGMLVAGGHGLEYLWQYGWAPGLILENMIPYYYYTDVPWLWEEPITGTIPALSTASVDVLFTSVVTDPMPLGTYTATLRVNGPGYPAIPDVDVTMHVVAAFEDPVASFTSNTPVRFGEAVDFTNTSTEGLPPTAYYEWEFGDGDTTTMLTADAVHHVYGKPGIYTVKLTAHQAQTGIEVAYTGTVVVTARLFLPVLWK